MTKKANQGKPKPANLTAHQQKEIVQAILKQYPVLKDHEDKIEFMVAEYSKDKRYIERLQREPEEVKRLSEETQAEIKTYSPEDPEYAEIMAKMEKARREFEGEIQISNDNIEHDDNIPLPAREPIPTQGVPPSERE